MKLFPTLAPVLAAALLTFSAAAQEKNSWDVQALNQILPGAPTGQVWFDLATGLGWGTNGVYINYNNGEAVLTADAASFNRNTGEVQADGHVRIESGAMLWVGEHIFYNVKTHQMRSEQFRTGQAPVFAGGEGLTGSIELRKGATNQVTARKAFVTTDDDSEPAYVVRASRIKVVPGQSVQMWNAVAYVEGVPVFYYPYYQRNLGPRQNNFMSRPGYRSRYGAFLLNTYTWYLGDGADGKIHADYRTRRGGGVGPEANLQLGQWGEAALKYYYVHDQLPNSSTNVFPQFGNMPHNRQLFQLGWQATPATHLNLKALVNYQSDPLLMHDFFEGDYTANPQPNTFIEAEKYWDNWSLNALTTPRVNSFFNQIERLPDVKLTGFRQQVLDTPVYYDSESTAGWYRSFITTADGFYPVTNGYYGDSAGRADTYHQLTLPWTFFNWLNVTPRAGGRLTYYSERASASGQEGEVTRGVFNTGVRTSFKAARLWAEATNSFLQVNGLRHIVEPSADYVYVPRPSTPAAQLPQFDGEYPSLLLMPIRFPDYNSIDAIDAQNVIRFGLRNLLQTKRGGQLDQLVNWNLLLDWRLDPQAGQSRLNDLYSQLAFRPRTWLTAESQLRYDLQHGDLNLAFHQLTFAPNNRWSWGIGHWYLRAGEWGNNPVTGTPYAWTENNYLTSTLFYRVNDNWGLRATHNLDAKSGQLQEQFYTLYRDFRSWTGALTFRVVNNVGGQQDYTVAFALSLKASPSVDVGEDTVHRQGLVGDSF